MCVHVRVCTVYMCVCGVCNVYMYVIVCLCFYSHMYMYMYVCVSTLMCVHVQRGVHTMFSACTCICVYVCVCVCVLFSGCTHV